MKKEKSQMIWPVDNYTDKIHSGVKMTMELNSHLSFTVNQLLPFLERGYTWLKNPNAQQAQWLKIIISKGLGKLIQMGKVKKVSSNVSVEGQWQWASAVANSGYTNVTSEASVAQTEEAQKAVGRRAISRKKLRQLNAEA